jgi:hypothetical protein
LVIEAVGIPDVALVPAFPITGLVASHEHNGALARIENEQCPQIAPARTHLFHVVVP